MSEYWKSQPKKFCDFCKCWITDNKASRDFHEKGKRHQENVRNKIDELKKKGLADAKKKDEENDYMLQMEKAALEAFKQDLANNPELAKQYNVKIKPAEGEVFEGPSLPGPDYVPPQEEEEKEAGEEKNGKEATEGEWYEAMSDMGYPYYWNTVTGESIWVAPEKYVSLADQGSAADASSSKAEESKETVSEVPKVEDIPLPGGVESIPLPGEPGSPPSPLESSSSEEEEEEDTKEDRTARGVYGTWERIREQEQVDLQLPTVQSDVETIAIPVLSDEPKVKFKEKRVALGPVKGNESVTFKKRKLGSGARNVRQRRDDND